MSKSVTAIVVTYNRQSAVTRCLQAVLDQSNRVNQVVIIDNASTDDTLKAIDQALGTNGEEQPLEKLALIGQQADTKIYLYRAAENGGGSRGFYLGMKSAHENFDSDLYWMMDDDGYPSKQCLEQLVVGMNDRYDYVMPTSINIDNHSQLSWPTRMKNGTKTSSYQELKDSWGKVMNFVTPFNGVLLSRKCVQEVGYINPQFFIWGDEYDHYWRCKQAGINPVTIMDAEFYHPAQKLPLVKIMFGLTTAPYVDQKWRMVCLARNYTYIYKHYGQGYKIPLKFIQYTWLFWFTRHGDFANWKLYIQSVRDGLKGDFTRHRQYLGK